MWRRPNPCTTILPAQLEFLALTAFLPLETACIEKGAPLTIRLFFAYHHISVGAEGTPS
jgi:hypothetical protein